MVKKAVVIYWSRTGNTERVARYIRDGLADAGVDVSLLRTDEADGVDYFDYDSSAWGSPPTSGTRRSRLRTS